MHRWNCTVMAALALACLVAGRDARLKAADESEAKPATAEAPKKASASPQFNVRAMAPPGASSRFNFKQQHLREHHISLRIKGKAGVQAMAKPAAETASSISTVFAAAEASSVEMPINHALTNAETNGDTSTVCEPSVAVRGNEVLFTGNWFAAFSQNGGGTFQYRNPANTFPASPQGVFCCDQVALYDRTNDLMCWALQYVNNSTGNTLRLAVAKGADITNEQWRYYDFTAQNVGNWPNEWFDFPDLALGEKNLYVTSNSFGTAANDFKRSVVLRLPLDQLAAYQALSYKYYSDGTFAPRATQGAGNTMYWANHKDTATLQVFTWAESSDQVQKNEVAVQAWSDADRVAPGPDGRDWLSRADSRITAAWMAGDTIGFAWTAAQDSTFHFPQVRVAILDKNSKNVTAQPHLWNNDFAFAYPAAAPNSDGRVGISLHYGGGTLYPSHAIGVFFPANGGQAAHWDLLTNAGGKFGPEDGKWGDFQAVRAHGSNPKTWVGTGWTLQTGPLRTDVEVRYIQFQLK